MTGVTEGRKCSIVTLHLQNKCPHGGEGTWRELFGFHWAVEISPLPFPVPVNSVMNSTGVYSHVAEVSVRAQ